MAAGKKTGGRKAGSKNKATKVREEIIAASGLTPLEFMLETMRDENQPISVRLDSAKGAAQYVHPKLSTVDLKSSDKSMSPKGLSEFYASLEQPSTEADA